MNIIIEILHEVLTLKSIFDNTKTIIFVVYLIIIIEKIIIFSFINLISYKFLKNIIIDFYRY